MGPKATDLQSRNHRGYASRSHCHTARFSIRRCSWAHAPLPRNGRLPRLAIIAIRFSSIDFHCRTTTRYWLEHHRSCFTFRMLVSVDRPAHQLDGLRNRQPPTRRKHRCHMETSTAQSRTRGASRKGSAGIRMVRSRLTRAVDCRAARFRRRRTGLPATRGTSPRQRGAHGGSHPEESAHPQ